MNSVESNHRTDNLHFWGKCEMLNLRNVTIVLALLSLVSGTAFASATFESSAGILEEGRYKTAKHPLGGPVAITQNDDPNTIQAGSSVACVGAATTDTGWWRLFDLDGDHGLSGETCVKSIDYGIESSVGTQDITAFVGCLDDSDPQPDDLGGVIGLTNFVDQVGGASQNQPDATEEFFNIAVDGCCDADSQGMVIGLISDDCQETGTCVQLFLGANSLGESIGPSYINAADCGLIDPLDLDLIGFASSHMLMVVNVNPGGGTTTTTTTGVPATTGMGVFLMVLILLGSSAYYMRRRVTN